jgi:hypothetical protein
MLQKDKIKARSMLAASLAADRQAARAEDMRRRNEDPEYKALAERRDRQAAEREVARIGKRMTARLVRAAGVTSEIETLQGKLRAVEVREPWRAAIVGDNIASKKFELNDLKREIQLDERDLKAAREALEAL